MVGAAVRLHAAGAVSSLEAIQCISWHGCPTCRQQGGANAASSSNKRLCTMQQKSIAAKIVTKPLLLATMGAVTAQDAVSYVLLHVHIDAGVHVSRCNYLFQTRWQ
jgi:hypothetical protein